MLFLANKLIEPAYRNELKLPLEFVCFAIQKGKMYTHKKDTFTVNWLWGDGNDVVYGAIYVLRDDFFHIRTVDAMHNCTLSALGYNHRLDLQHRVAIKVTPIAFNSIDELTTLRYRELEQIEVEMYIGNRHHPTILNRINRTQKSNYRVKNGIQRMPYLAQCREEDIT